MKQFFTKFKKPLIIFVVVAVVVIMMAIFVPQIGDKLRQQKEQHDVEKEIKFYDLTINDAQRSALARKLYAAMSGFGTDEDQIFAAFDLPQTDSDIYAIIATFGVKDDKTLPEWIADELSQKDIDQLNNQLAAKNINYRF